MPISTLLPDWVGLALPLLFWSAALVACSTLLLNWRSQGSAEPRHGEAPMREVRITTRRIVVLQKQPAPVTRLEKLPAELISLDDWRAAA